LSLNTVYLNLVKYVHSVDGFVGLYRGFGCSLLSKVVCWYTTTKVDEVDYSNFIIISFWVLLIEQLLGPVEPRVPNDQVKPTWNKCVQKVWIIN
jgi:hypothetical protein